METRGVLLGVPDQIVERLKDGRYVREGGVIRERESGKLVAFLPEVDAHRAGMEDLIASQAVPLVVLGVSNSVLERRLQVIDAKLDTLITETREIRAEQEYLAILAESAAIGRAAGTLQAMRLDPCPESEERAARWFGKLMEHYGELSMSTIRMARSPRVFRRHPESFQLHQQAAFLVGVCARDLLVRVGKKESARETSHALSRDAGTMRTAIEEIRSNPSSLFWIAPSHFRVIADTWETDARLKGHVIMLQTVPFRRIRRIEPIDREELT